MTYRLMIVLSSFLLLTLWFGSVQPSQAQEAVNCQTVTDISSGECQALLNIYQNNNGRNWVPYTNWLSNNQPCSWRGVMCSNGHVVSLSLIYMDLSGRIPGSIGNLPYLEVLNLSNNHLIGPIPDWLGNLRNLRILALSYNQLTGGVPASLGNLSNLQELRVAGNQLSGEVPGSLGSLANLKALDIRDTQLTGALPGSLVNLKLLTDLLFRNSLVCEPVDPGFMAWVSRLKYLERNDNYCDVPPTPTPSVITTVVAAPTPVVNVIRNGGFEQPGPEDIGVATYWQYFDNSNAHFGWYDEQWLEAVYNGEHSQLMEIYQVYGDFKDRVIAIHQTVDVAPNSYYVLTFQALMRSTSLPGDRNKGGFQMDWGVDYSGQGNYEFISQQNGWFKVDKLPEQPYFGSTNPETSDAQYLTFQRVRATIYTGENRRITLFIRGVKKYPSNVEVNFNLDEVTLVGPPPNGAVNRPAVSAVTVTSATVPSAVTPSASSLKITHILADAPGADNENPNGEWVEIANQGQQTIAMQGYTLRDVANHVYIFGNFSLAAGARVRLYTGPGQDSATSLYWGFAGASVWNNDGDTATLYNPQGTIVSSYNY